MGLLKNFQSPLKFWHFAFGILAGLLVMTLIIGTSLDEKVEKELGYPTLFSLRDKLGMGPHINDKLKIYTIDDYSLAKMQGWVLSLPEWRELLLALSARNPKAIFIDAVLSKTLTDDPLVTPDKTNKGLAHSQTTKTVSGIFLAPQKIMGREPFSLAPKNLYEISTYTLEGYDSQLYQMPGPPQIDWQIYGYHPSYSSIISHAGHILNFDGTFIAPLIKLSPTKLIPHLFTFAADKIKLGNHGFWMDDRWVPVNDKYLMIPNWPNPVGFNSQKYSLAPVLERIKNGAPIDEINQGDIVLIIPQYYTGNTDFKRGPMGKVPGGIYHATLLNDYLNNQFLNYLDFPWTGSMLLIVIGVLLSSSLSGSTLLLGLSAFLGFYLLSVVAFFVYGGYIISWFTPILSAFMSSGTILAIRYQMNEKKVTLMHQAFDGIIPHQTLLKLLNNPQKFSFDAQETILTVMFIDIVNFSLISRKNHPKQVFHLMKSILKELTEVIHSHDGIIDKTLGDGMLCYFGNNVHESEVKLVHAERAINCALEIQKKHGEKANNAVNIEDQAFSLRIGINTDICFMGDLGSGQRIDYTIIGDGVNIAKRLETACHPNQILISESCFKLLSSEQQSTQKWKKRNIKIKNQEGEKLCYELNPLESTYANIENETHDNFEFSDQFDSFNTSSLLQKPAPQLWHVTDNEAITTFVNGHNATIVAFSGVELHIKCDWVLLSDDVVSIVVDVKNAVVDNVLQQNNLKKLNAQVDWGQEHIDGFYYYVLFWQGLNEFEGELLEKQLLLATNAVPLELQTPQERAV